MDISRTLRRALGRQTDPNSKWGHWAWISGPTKAVLVRLRFAGRSLPNQVYHRQYREGGFFDKQWHSLDSVTPRDEARFWTLVLRGLWMIALLKLRLIR